MGNRWCAICLWAAILVLPPILCHAQQVSPEDEYKQLVKIGQTIQPLGAHPVGENISLYDGTLSFEETDISLPGIGPTLQLGRSLKTADGSLYNLNRQRPFGDWDLDIPRIDTYTADLAGGWKVANGPGRCTDFGPPPVVTDPQTGDPWGADQWWYGYNLIIPGEGSQNLMGRDLHNTHAPATGSYGIITKQDWMIGCGVTASDGGEGFLAISPDGTRYTFSHLVYRPLPEVTKPRGVGPDAIVAGGFHPMIAGFDIISRHEALMYVTKIEDRFGNTLTYNWSGNNLTSIVASDGRKVTLAYVAGTPRIQSVTVQTTDTPPRTWTYNYGTSADPPLISVQLPDGNAWAYQMGSLQSAVLRTEGGDCETNRLPILESGSASGSITAPSGLTATFTLAPMLHGRSYVPKGCDGLAGSGSTYAVIPDEYYQLSLTKEVLSGPGMPTETWTYSYSAPNASWTLDACAQAHNCPTTVYTDVTDSLGHTTRSTFSNRYDASEGELLHTDIYSGAAGSTILRSVANTYANPTGGPWPSFYGDDPQRRDNPYKTQAVSPLQKRVITQDGATFTTTINSFDAYARATSETETGTASKTDTTSYADDKNHWVLGSVTSTATNGIVSDQTDYDSLDRPIHHYVFGKLESTNAWNANGTLATVTDGNNHTTTFSSWYRGVPEKITYADGTAKLATVNGNGWITSLTDENGFTTNYAYDPMGRLTSITYPTGDDVAWTPTLISLGRIDGATYAGIPNGVWVRSVHTALGDHVNTYLDALWRPIMVLRCDSAAFANTVSNVVTRYDAAGRLIFRSYPIGNITDYTAVNTGSHISYDALGRATQVKEDSELGTLTSTTQYLPGFETKVTNPRGYATVTSYQAFGEPTTKFPDSVTAPEGELTVIMRDVFGKPLSITRTGTTQGAPQVTRYYVYRPDFQTLCKVIEPETGATVMDFDGAGNLGWSASGLTLTDTNSCDLTTAFNSGRAVHRTYDARNRMLTLSFPDGNGNQTWAYTADGLPAQVVTANAGNNITNKYFYDKRRLMWREELWGPIDRQGTNRGTFAWGHNYGHNANGHLSSVTNQKGTVINYAPNALGQPSRAGGYATGASYYPDGKLKQFTFGNGVVHTMTENVRGLPSRLTDFGAQGQPASLDSIYSYDADGNVSAINDVARTNFDRTMTYDGLDRLVGVNSGKLGGQYNMSYGPLDNLRVLQHIGGSTSTYTYDSHNRLGTISNTINGITSLAWDVQGNLASKGGRSYQFDYGNRLREVPGSESYMYDAYGHRVEQVGVVLPTIFRSYTRAGQLDFESDERNGAMRGYIYLGSTLLAIQDYTHNSVFYQTTDALGSIIAQTNVDAWVDHFNYYSFWGSLQSGDLSDGPGYAGQVHDTNTELSYDQQRYYDPTLSRFVSVDPVGVNPDTGANFNRYWYANDNPYRYTDPDGRQDADAYARLRSAQQSMPNVPMTLVKMGNTWQPVPTAVAANVMLSQASGTTLGQYTAPPTRQGAASALDKVSVGATTVAVATAADAPPVAAAAGVVDETAATLAFALDPTPARALNVATVGALGALKVAAKGSAEAVESVHNLEKATQANTLLNAAMPPSVSPAQRVPAPPPPPPPPRDKDH